MFSLSVARCLRLPIANKQINAINLNTKYSFSNVSFGLIAIIVDFYAVAVLI